MEIKLISCPLCSKPHFEGVDSLRSTLINVATSHLSCPVCDEALLGLDKLTIHLFSHINTDNNEFTTKENEPVPEFSCGGDKNSNNNNICDNNNCEVTLQVEVNKNIETVTRQIDQDVVNDEKPEIAPENETVLRCDICNFNFNDKIILEMHQKLLHQTIPDKNTGLYNYHCHLCSKKFKKRGSLMVHLRVAHYSYSHQDEMPYKFEKVAGKIQKVKDEVGVDGKILKNVSGQNKSDNNKQWECDVCSKLFTTKYFLKKHKRLHTGEMPYTCTQCNKSFTFQQSYHKHMLYHSSDKPYVCNECGRAFKELSTLQNHARIHSGERPFVCETCGKRFRQRVSYLVHRRIHTGVMPYKCTICDKSFRYKVSQRSHKCFGSPPGSVVRISEITGSQSELASNGENNSTTCGLSVDFNTGNINFTPEVQKMDSDLLSRNNDFGSEMLKQSIVLSNNEQIQITYNKSDLTSALLDNGRLSTQTKMNVSGDGEFSNKNETSKDPLKVEGNGGPDLFSMIMSPLLPEVESLCLTSNSPITQDVHTNGASTEMLSTMNEESLKELIYGVLDKCG